MDDSTEGKVAWQRHLAAGFLVRAFIIFHNCGQGTKGRKGEPRRGGSAGRMFPPHKLGRRKGRCSGRLVFRSGWIAGLAN